jgi:hypothetical protein
VPDVPVGVGERGVAQLRLDRMHGHTLLGQAEREGTRSWPSWGRSVT